jgi:hypothetical protein
VNRSVVALAAAMLACTAGGMRPVLPDARPALREPDGMLDDNWLRESVELIAHDSMRGRWAGSPDAASTAQWIAARLTHAGWSPLPGARGFLERVPLVVREADTAARIVLRDGPYLMTSLIGAEYRPASDFVVLSGRVSPRFPSAARTHDRPVSFGGRLGTDSLIRPLDASGRIVVFHPPLRADGSAELRLEGWADHLAPYASAAAVLIPALSLLTPEARERLTRPLLSPQGSGGPLPDLPPTLIVSRAVASGLLNVWSDAATLGYDPESHASVRFAARTRPVQTPVWNVAAMLPGSDPSLREEVIVVAAHYDHRGIAAAGSPGRNFALRERDSVFNGADDNASGAVALAAIAERLARTHARSRRSVVLLWSAGGEHGEHGAAHFLRNLARTRLRVVAALDVDMIGGTPGHERDVYLLVPESGATGGVATSAAEAAARADQKPLRVELRPLRCTDDSRQDCSTIACEFGRRRIPVARVTTGRRAVHQTVADEPDAIDYPALRKVAEWVARWTGRLADDANGAPRGDRAGSGRTCSSEA